MIYSWIEKNYFKLKIKLLLKFRPTVLFDKINQLYWYQNTLRQWVDDQKFTMNSNVLEVGCASGSLTAYIAKLGCIPTGADFSKGMIKLAKVKNNNIKFLVANVFDLPFESEFFDGVIAASLINIVKNKNKAINELARTCKKGGTVTVLVPLSEFENLHSLQISLGNSGFSYAAMNAWHRLPPKMKASEVAILFNQAGLIKITEKNYLQGMVVSVSALKPL